MLKEKGHTVIDCTNENAVNQLNGIVNKANTQSLDLFCRIHLNSGGGHGTETYIWNGTWSNKFSYLNKNSRNVSKLPTYS